MLPAAVLDVENMIAFVQPTWPFHADNSISARLSGVLPEVWRHKKDRGLKALTEQVAQL